MVSFLVLKYVVGTYSKECALEISTVSLYVTAQQVLCTRLSYKTEISEFNTKFAYVLANPGGRAIQSVGLQPQEFWNGGFESR
jgi:hypothetical protein